MFFLHIKNLGLKFSDADTQPEHGIFSEDELLLLIKESLQHSQFYVKTV